MFDYNREPINKTAFFVTSQSGCAADDTLTDEQKRENLVSKVKGLDEKLLSYPKGSTERKEIGRQKAELCSQINSLRPKRKCKDVKDYVLDVLRDELSDVQFKRILHKASLLAEKNDKIRS